MYNLVSIFYDHCFIISVILQNVISYNKLISICLFCLLFAEYYYKSEHFEVLITVSILWVVVPCDLTGRCKHFL
jgi:hypothetical protein